MSRFLWSAALLAVLGSVLTVSAAAGPTDPPYPLRIDFPAPSVDPTTGAVTTNFSPEGIEIQGDTFWAGSTQTGEIIKGNLKTGTYQRNWVPASPAQPSDLHRGVLGLLVDSHNRLWAATSYGMACGGTNQPACPAGVTGPFTNYGIADVYDATTGQHLAQYTLSTAASKTINDMTISGNAVFFSNTSAPNGAGSEVQFKLQLGPGGALPPEDVPPPAPGRGSVNPAVTAIPTPGFTGADGIDTLPNGNILVNSFNGTSSGQMIVINATTLAVTPVTVTAAPTCLAGSCAPPLLSGDGVTLDGNMLYTPENRLDTLTPPGDVAAVKLLPPDYTSAQIVARLNSPPGSGLPPLRSPANTGQLGHLVYVISRVVSANPVTGVANVTQTFIERLSKLAPTVTGSAVSAVEGASFSGTVASISDPNTGEPASNLTATVDWGDGTISSGTVSGSAGCPIPTSTCANVSTFSAAGTHTYAEEGTYTVTTTIGDAITGFTLGTTTSTATVADAPLAAGPIAETCSGSGSCSVSFHFTDANAGATAADFSASIDWGDGTTSKGTVAASGGGFVVTGSHTYADGGNGHAVTVTVTDDGGSMTSASTPATTTALAAQGNGVVNGNAQSAMFTIAAGCSTGTASATLNGVPVQDGDVVRLKNDGSSSVRLDGNHLSFTGSSFVLVVTCTDASGNQGSATSTFAFSAPGSKGHGK